MTGVLEPRAVLGVLLLVVQASLAFPLIVKLWRSHDRRGISLSGEMIWIIGGLGWGVYALLADSPAVLISSVIAIVTSTALSLLLWRSARGQQRIALALTALTFVALATSLIAGLTGLSIALSIFGVLQFVPQLLLSARQLINAESAQGVSAVGVAIRAVYTLGWSVWAAAPVWLGGSLTDIDWPVLTWGLAGATAFTLQVAVVLRSRREI